MKTRASLVSLGLLAASFGPALADNVSATVERWDASTRTLTLDDKSQFADIPKEVSVPDMKHGDLVTIDYYADEDGIQAINAITANRDIAKRVLPQTQKGG
jgi:hypothetical protein